MEYGTLIILGAALIGAAVVFVYLRRLKRAAVHALEVARRMEESMESLRATAATIAPPEQADGDGRGDADQGLKG